MQRHIKLMWDYHTWTMEETRIFEAEGEALPEIVQCELGAGFHLTYHGEGG